MTLNKIIVVARIDADAILTIIWRYREFAAKQFGAVEGSYPSLLKDGCCRLARRTSLVQLHYQRQTIRSPTPKHINTLYRKYGRLLPAPRPRQGRLPLRTSSPRTTDPSGADMRRMRIAHELANLAAMEDKELRKITMADMLRTTARNGCSRHDVRWCLPPFRRQLQGRPAVSSHQGRQQGRGGLHPVCFQHDMRRDALRHTPRR